MANIDNFLSTLDIFYCESIVPTNHGDGEGCAGAYSVRENDSYKFKGNGFIGTDFYGKGNGFMGGYGDGTADSFNIVNDKDKGYGKPYIKN